MGETVIHGKRGNVDRGERGNWDKAEQRDMRGFIEKREQRARKTRGWRKGGNGKVNK